jgi:restriction system protein
MVPVLRALADGLPHKNAWLREQLAKELQLTEADLAEKIASGSQQKFTNRIAWSITHLKGAGLIERVGPGEVQIAGRGQEILLGKPDRLKIKDLLQFPEYRAFRKADSPEKNNHHGEPEPDHPSDKTPEETLAEIYETLRHALAAELLEAILKGSPTFFEKLVVDLLVKMGYGGSLVDAGQAVGKSGDDGVDGIIKEDKLGLDVVHIQAKRWKGNVGRPDVQSFVGSLAGRRARKGVFITTSDFSQDAREYVQRIDAKVVLINGRELAELMIDHGLGVTQVRTYIVNRIDNDYFDEE